MRFHDFTTFFVCSNLCWCWTFLHFSVQFSSISHRLLTTNGHEVNLFCWSFGPVFPIHGIHFLSFHKFSGLFSSCCYSAAAVVLLLLYPHLITILILDRHFTRKSVNIFPEIVLLFCFVLGVGSVLYVRLLGILVFCFLDIWDQWGWDFDSFWLDLEWIRIFDRYTLKTFLVQKWETTIAKKANPDFQVWSLWFWFLTKKIYNQQHNCKWNSRIE